MNKNLGILAMFALFCFMSFSFVSCSDDNDSEKTGQVSAEQTKHSEEEQKNITYIGKKKPEEPKEVGDIVFSDGSATPYTDYLALTDEQIEKAISVIFYVGTECSNDDKSRMLGIGLVCSGSGLAWCTEDANSKDAFATNNYSRGISTITCKPDDGSGNTKEMKFENALDKNGNDNLSQIGAFLKENDINDDTGIEEKYPAFYFAKNYMNARGSRVKGSNFEDGWYFPSTAEVFQIMKTRYLCQAAVELCHGVFPKGNCNFWTASSNGVGQGDVVTNTRTRFAMPFTETTNVVLAIREF